MLPRLVAKVTVNKRRRPESDNVRADKARNKGGEVAAAASAAATDTAATDADATDGEEDKVDDEMEVEGTSDDLKTMAGLVDELLGEMLTWQPKGKRGTPKNASNGRNRGIVRCRDSRRRISCEIRLAPSNAVACVAK